MVAKRRRQLTSDFPSITISRARRRRRFAVDGTPIFALAEGIVHWAGPYVGYGELIVIEHTINGQRVASAYGHMWPAAVYVSVGERLTAGEHIGDIGSSGRSTGPHPHLEIRPGGAFKPSIDAETWLVEHQVAGLDAATSATSACLQAPRGDRMDIFPDFGTVGGASDLRAIVGALRTYMLIFAVLASAFPAVTARGCQRALPGQTSR